jgi:hypothetical protein
MWVCIVHRAGLKPAMSNIKQNVKLVIVNLIIILLEYQRERSHIPYRHQDTATIYLYESW